MSKEVKLEDLRKGDYIQHKLGGDKYEVLGVSTWGLKFKAPSPDIINAWFGSLTSLGFVGYRATPKVEHGVIYRKPKHPADVIFYDPPKSIEVFNWYSTENGWLVEEEVNDLLATGEYEALPKE